MRGTIDESKLAGLPALATKTEVAAFLGVSARTVDRLREAGELATFFVGRRSVRITVASVAAYLKRQLPADAPSASSPVEAEPEADLFAIPLLAELQAKAAARRQTPVGVSA